MDKNQINIKKLETYTFSEKEINNIILLNDGRLSLSCWYEGNIFIFDKNFDIEIKFKVRTINYYTQLSNDNLIICGYQKIYIYKIGVKSLQLLEELHEHYDEVFKVIELNNKNLITCSKDGFIRIWQFLNDKYISIKKIYFCEDYKMDMVKTDDNKLIISAHGHRIINFFDMNNNFSLLTKINDIIAFNLNIIHNILFIGTYNGLYLINLKNCKKSYLFENYKYIKSILPLKNGNILIGCHIEKNNNSNNSNFKDWSGYIIEYKYENDNLNKIRAIKTNHTNVIKGIFQLKENIILSWSFDNEFDNENKKIHIWDLN